MRRDVNAATGVDPASFTAPTVGLEPTLLDAGLPADRRLQEGVTGKQNAGGNPRDDGSLAERATHVNSRLVPAADLRQTRRMISTVRLVLRDLAAVATVALFLAPIAWWLLSSITPGPVLLDVERFLALDFAPTLENFAVVLSEAGGTVFDGRDSLRDSVIVAALSTVIVLAAALPMAFALSHFTMTAKPAFLRATLFLRFLPPVAIVSPLVLIYHGWGLVDSSLGLAFAHAALNLPFAVLVLKSFFDDIPPEIGEAATLDGATRFQHFSRIALPLVKGGVAVTAILAFIFSWTEFLLALFLTQQMRTVPVQAAILVMNTWSYLAAFTTAALLPAFFFILIAQRHLARGLTLGMTR
jgi:multiple sugar transport system permease protein